jgi:hypothetical protein
VRPRPVSPEIDLVLKSGPRPRGDLPLAWWKITFLRPFSLYRRLLERQKSEPLKNS